MNNFDFCGGNDNSIGHEAWKMAKRFNDQTKAITGSKCQPIIKRKQVKQITPWVG